MNASQQYVRGANAVGNFNFEGGIGADFIDAKCPGVRLVEGLDERLRRFCRCGRWWLFRYNGENVYCGMSGTDDFCHASQDDVSYFGADGGGVGRVG